MRWTCSNSAGVGVILMITLRDKSDEIVEGVDCNVKEEVLNTF